MRPSSNGIARDHSFRFGDVASGLKRVAIFLMFDGFANGSRRIAATAQTKTAATIRMSVPYLLTIRSSMLTLLGSGRTPEAAQTTQKQHGETRGR